MWVLLPLMGGMLVSLQSVINGTLGKKIGTIESTYISFFTGSILLTLVVIFLGDGNLLGIINAPLWQLICAIFGFGFIFIMAFSVPVIGATATNATVVIGQLISSMIIDHFGWFGSDVVPFTLSRFIGIILMIIALYFIFMESTIVKKRTEEKMERSEFDN